MSDSASTLYVGTVKSNKLDGKGCIEISIPGIGDSFFARIATQMAGKDRGVLFLPEEHDQVLVASVVGSDVKWAVIGSLWSSNALPKETNSDGKNDLKVIRTRGGNVFKLTDKDGDESIEIGDRTGDNKITINTKTNAVAIHSAGSISIKAPNGDVVIQGKTVNIN